MVPRASLRAASVNLTTLNEALGAVDSTSRPWLELQIPGDRPGDMNVKDARTAPRGSAKSSALERETRGRYSACPSNEKSIDLQALLMPEEGLEPPTRGL